MLKSDGGGDQVQVAEGKWRPLVVEVGSSGLSDGSQQDSCQCHRTSSRQQGVRVLCIYQPRGLCAGEGCVEGLGVRNVYSQHMSVHISMVRLCGVMIMNTCVGYVIP